MRMTRLIIKNYCGVASADLAIPPAGILIKGGNARGKTSILRAIRAALLARGVDASAIRNGEDKSEILVDMDALHVRRSIRPRGNDLTVAGADGMVLGKPQTILDDLFGRDIDPLEFYKADDKKRRKLIYEMMPMRVTADDVYRWTGEKWVDVPDDHGLEVLERIRRKFYDLRTQANADTEEADRKYRDLAASASAMAEVNDPGASTPGNVEVATKRVKDAEDALAKLQGKRDAFAATCRSIDEQRTRAADLRGQADEKDTKRLRFLQQRDEFRLDTTEQLAQALEALGNIRAEVERSRDAHAEAVRLRRQADELEIALGRVIADAATVPAEEVERAISDLDARRGDLTRAQRAAEYATLCADRDRAEKEHRVRVNRAKHLDQVVKKLTNDAPGELAAREKGIPGLTLGDRIELDGVPLDINSGMEQMRFAIDLAKRARTGGRVLICDGLERLDEEEFPAFVKHAVTGGWQMIGTRVTKGPLEIIAITGEEE